MVRTVTYEDNYLIVGFQLMYSCVADRKKTHTLSHKSSTDGLNRFYEPMECLASGSGSPFD